MAKIEEGADTLNLETGRLCLDFANTAGWHASDQPIEGFNSYSDLVLWAQQVGVLTDVEARLLFEETARHPVDTAAILEQAISLREAIYRIFSAVAGGGSAEAADLDILNVALSGAFRHLQIIQTADGFTWGWVGGDESLGRMLWPVARSAVELLTSGELNRVGQCADDRGCGWLFFDTSRNRSRRWCDMKGCGNRDKVRRYYQQKRAVRPGS